MPELGGLGHEACEVARRCRGRGRWRCGRPRRSPMAHGLPGSSAPALEGVVAALAVRRPMGWMGGRYTHVEAHGGHAGQPARRRRRSRRSDRGNSSYQAPTRARSRSTQSGCGLDAVRSAAPLGAGQGAGHGGVRAGREPRSAGSRPVSSRAAGRAAQRRVAAAGRASSNSAPSAISTSMSWPASSLTRPCGPRWRSGRSRPRRRAGAGRALAGVDGRLPLVVAQSGHRQRRPTAWPRSGLGRQRRTRRGQDVVAVLEDVAPHPHPLADHRLGRIGPVGRAGAHVVDHEASGHTSALPTVGSCDRHRHAVAAARDALRSTVPSSAMRALRSFTVRARLPEALGPPARAGLQPALVVGRPHPGPVPLGRPAALGADRPRPGAAARPGRPPSGSSSWPPTRPSWASWARSTTTCAATSRRPAGSRTGRPAPLRAVAYFSPEFGIAEALPQYSGGLGVLAGDHLKAASGLGVPLVGVGLLLPPGLLPPAAQRRRLAGGALPRPRPARHGPRPGRGRPGPGRPGRRAAGRPGLAGPGRPGRSSTCSTPTSTTTTTSCRAVTDRLYGGGTEHRIRQEILLGIGGVRALEAVGRETQVFHTNEGHAGFLGLERIRAADHRRRADASPRPSRRSGPAPSSPPTRPCRPASTASRAS